MLGGATFCVLFAPVQYDALRDPRLAFLGFPALLLITIFFRRERRLTRLQHEPLVDLRLFRVPSYKAGVLLALAFFPAMAGLPLVLALYYQRGLGYTPLQSGLGITAYALGSAIAAPLAGRVVTRIGRPLVVGATVSFGAGAIGLAILILHTSNNDVALILSPALFVMGAASGTIITPNQALTLMAVDPASGSTAGGVLQTAQRIGNAIGQAVIGAVFFAELRSGHSPGDYGRAFSQSVVVALGFVGLAVAVGILDLKRRARPEPR